MIFIKLFSTLIILPKISKKETENTYSNKSVTHFKSLFPYETEISLFYTQQVVFLLNIFKFTLVHSQKSVVNKRYHIDTEIYRALPVPLNKFQDI